jgi:RNA polymerase sigma-70 factor (ECF subfamily)
MERKRGAPRAEGRQGEPRLDFQEIHRLYRPRIFRYLARLVGPSEAEDVTQEVFIKVSRAMKNFRGGSRVSTWIYKIATNAALDEVRKPNFKRSETAPADRPCSTGDPEVGEDERTARAEEESNGAELSLIHQEMFDCLRTYIDRLPPNLRAVVVLSVLEGMKNREIADILGISLEMAKIRLHRGRSKLVKELEAHCGWYRDRRNRLTWDGTIL